MSTIKALIIQPDGTAEARGIEPALSVLQEIVGGYIEPIGGTKANWIGYCNEEGKLDMLAINPVATKLAGYLGWPNYGVDVLVGPVVFVGLSGDDGNDTDVPEELLAALTDLYPGALST